MKIFVYERPWALFPEILHQLRTYEGVGKLLTERAAAARSPQSSGAIAVLPLHGIILQRAGWFGTSIEMFTQAFRHALADPQVSSIVIDVDSPGGEVSGVPELAAEIMAARQEKKIVAVANSFAASAAYWIASAASEFVASPSAMVGSIGIYALHVDFSKALDAAGIKPTFISAGKFKVEGNEFEPLAEEAATAIQKDVDAFYEMFVRDVARGRGASMKAVRQGFGEGRMVMAADAQEMGMIDRVATLDETIARLMKSSARASAVGGRACAACGGTGRTVAIENGVPKILNEDCPGCQGSGEAAAEVPAAVVEPAVAPPAAEESGAELAARAAVAADRLRARQENDRARLRLLELS